MCSGAGVFVLDQARLILREDADLPGPMREALEQSARESTHLDRVECSALLS
jgi:hypothetical protein